jgi:thiamine monophosphate synthase
MVQSLFFVFTHAQNTANYIGLGPFLSHHVRSSVQYSGLEGYRSILQKLKQQQLIPLGQLAHIRKIEPWMDTVIMAYQAY